MIDYLITHQQTVHRLLTSSESKKELDQLLILHEEKIRYFQHERLIHLLVTLAVGIGLVVSIYATMIIQHPMLYLVDILLCMLFVPYIFHYRKLENGVQDLYKLDDDIRKKRDEVK